MVYKNCTSVHYNVDILLEISSSAGVQAQKSGDGQAEKDRGERGLSEEEVQTGSHTLHCGSHQGDADLVFLCRAANRKGWLIYHLIIYL